MSVGLSHHLSSYFVQLMDIIEFVRSQEIFGAEFFHIFFGQIINPMIIKIISLIFV